MCHMHVKVPFFLPLPFKKSVHATAKELLRPLSKYNDNYSNFFFVIFAVDQDFRAGVERHGGATQLQQKNE